MYRHIDTASAATERTIYIHTFFETVSDQKVAYYYRDMNYIYVYALKGKKLHNMHNAFCYFLLT